MELYSPQYHVGKVPKEVKVLMAHGEEDSPSFKSQGNDYHKVRGATYIIVMFPCSRGHTSEIFNIMHA